MRVAMLSASGRRYVGCSRLGSSKWFAPPASISSSSSCLASSDQDTKRRTTTERPRRVDAIARPLHATAGNTALWISASRAHLQQRPVTAGLLFTPKYEHSYLPLTSRRTFGTTTKAATDLSTPDSSISNSDFSTSTTDTTSLSVDETLNKLFEESASTTLQAGGGADGSGDAWYAAADTASSTLADVWTPVWYNCSDQAIVAVTAMHDWSGLSVGWSIVATTVALRVVLFPLLVQAQQSSSRMAHVQPELTVLKLRYEKLGSPTRAEQLQFSAQMKALFTKYQVNPFKTLVAPIVQLPVFVGMFFGLQKMPSIYPDMLSNGGMFWFVDLTVPDPLYILPVVSAASFLALIEMGKEQMMVTSPGAQGEMMVNVFRFMAIISLPFCASFDAAILCYWASNNIMTIGQTALLKHKAVRSYFGIWEPPKPVPGSESPGLLTSVSNLVKTVQGEAVTEAQKIKQHNQQVEAQKTSFRMTRAARERRRTGITGTKNN